MLSAGVCLNCFLCSCRMKYDVSAACLPSYTRDIVIRMTSDRKEMANTIVNDPHSYKICVVCGAIVDRAVDSCPDCLAYRFDEDATHVADHALDMAVRPQTAVSHLDLSQTGE